ncbi:MAG: Zn-ribbon domain-containing OB-fold protein [Armatimonadota bacterium]|nr:Zn-ribbon domain-containing OB-fold protein [Armatimonadota bacterium]MDR7400648.1 Zn-ribbon domain-containing OB-fold protein [Armatimonadota bacterium]MDR7403176.1 Zn-ribbon domain-containing OB-fold protein [Armatimonadota bacterium]MDR7436541.1 Zn-ribbon domain-containing OB-fold protein [Armatimonadota bacterium]MDR7472576.1 Zn-ribbon domain-containing OB-fold protein [Armatimonadota bacterium]
MARPRLSRETPAAPPRAPRGTPLSDEEMARASVASWTPALEYAWDAGEAISRFLAGLRDGRILGVRCRACGRTVTPPRVFCELDFRPMDEWVELPDTGTINTFSICYITWDMKPLRRPQIPAVIEIDGTSPRGGFLHLIGGVRGRTVEEIRRQIAVGTPVRAVWKPAARRTGAITDILHFAPVKSHVRP